MKNLRNWLITDWRHFYIHYRNTIFGYNIPKEFHFIKEQSIFLVLTMPILLTQLLKHLLRILDVVLFWPRVNQNIISIHQNTFIKQVIEHQIHAVISILMYFWNKKTLYRTHMCHCNATQVTVHCATALWLVVQPYQLCTAQPVFLVQSPILGLPAQAKASQVLFQMPIPVL